MKLVCPLCNNLNIADAKFCSTCGEGLELERRIICSNCSFTNSIEAIFCGSCGISLKSGNPSQTTKIGLIQNNISTEKSPKLIEEQIKEAEKLLNQLRKKIGKLSSEIRELDEQAHIQSFGFYEPRYDFESSQIYQSRLDQIRKQQKEMIKDKTAAICTAQWTVDGSRVEGRKKTNQTLKLMLRAFNGEADAAITKVKYNNIRVMEKRIEKSFEMINKLSTSQHAHITYGYLNLKLEELYLVHEYQEKRYEEIEEKKEIRRQMREEAIAQKEFEKAMQDAEREEKRYEVALETARKEIDNDIKNNDKLLEKIKFLEEKLEEAHQNKERAIARAQITRSGHVYIISNVGSFGEGIYKIGMTRRLDPFDRVIELGSASVPFKFDIHAIIYSQDAPSLENKLHKKFSNSRINLVNNRKEFFRVSLDEIIEAVREFHGDTEFTLLSEAKEYRKTIAASTNKVQNS